MLRVAVDTAPRVVARVLDLVMGLVGERGDELEELELKYEVLAVLGFED